MLASPIAILDVDNKAAQRSYLAIASGFTWIAGMHAVAQVQKQVTRPCAITGRHVATRACVRFCFQKL